MDVISVIYLLKMFLQILLLFSYSLPLPVSLFLLRSLITLIFPSLSHIILVRKILEVLTGLWILR